MKKIRLVLIILVSAGVLYFIGSLVYGITKSMGKKNHDFSYVDLSFDIHPDDSVYFSETTKSNLAIQYTSEFKHYQYLSLYSYRDKYNLIVRKLADTPADLKALFKLEFAKGKVDPGVTYNMQEAYPFIYKIDVDRPHGLNMNLFINGNHIEILKHNADSLWIHGNIIDLAIGKKGSYINEILYTEDETIFAKAVNTELLLFNRDNKLYFYILFPDGKQTVPKGILNEIK